MFKNNVTCEGIRRAMYENPMPDFTSAEDQHLAACNACTELLLTRMLDQKPQVVVPAEFAARVRSQLARENVTAKTLRRIPAYGFTTAIAVLLVLAIAWTVFAYVDPQWWTIRGTLSLLVESVVTLEIGGIALWLGTRSSIS